MLLLLFAASGLSLTALADTSSEESAADQKAASEKAPGEKAPTSSENVEKAPNDKPSAGAPLKIEPGKAFALSCETRAVVVASDAANATSGTIRLDIMPSAEDARKGTWSVGDVGATHTGGFGARRKALCAEGCPYTVSDAGDTQLWAPGPKSLDSLQDDETLLIAVIKPKGLGLRASSFRGKDIEALEEGQCKVIP